MERLAMRKRLRDSESSDADGVEVRLYVNDSSIGIKDALARKSALIKHFSSFGKVTDILSAGPEASVLHLRGEAAVVENKETFNDGGCECDVVGGCKIVVVGVDPQFNDDPFDEPCGYCVPEFYLERARLRFENLERKKAKRPEPMKPMKAKKKAKKPEPMKSNGSSDAYNDPTPTLNDCTILVSGYDKKLPEGEIKTLMLKHFFSCGEITDIYFANMVRKKWFSDKKGILLDIEGDNAEENALLLNRSVVGGRKLAVKVVPPEAFDLVFKSSPAIIRRMNEEKERLRQMPPPPDIAVVTGFDTGLPLDDIKSALTKHFSSCGEITFVSILNGENGGLDNKASLFFREKGAAYKAFQLSGIDVGGWKADVVHHISPMHETYLT